MTFYDREAELDTLTAAVESPGADFIVVYGDLNLDEPTGLEVSASLQPHKGRLKLFCRSSGDS